MQKILDLYKKAAKEHSLTWYLLRDAARYIKNGGYVSAGKFKNQLKIDLINKDLKYTSVLEINKNNEGYYLFFHTTPQPGNLSFLDFMYFFDKEQKQIDLDSGLFKDAPYVTFYNSSPFVMAELIDVGIAGWVADIPKHGQTINYLLEDIKKLTIGPLRDINELDMINLDNFLNQNEV